MEASGCLSAGAVRVKHVWGSSPYSAFPVVDLRPEPSPLEFLVSLNGTGLAIVGAPDSCLKGWRDQESQHLKRAPEAAGFVKCFEWFLARGRHGMSISVILVVISGEGRGSGARPHWA